MIVDIATLEHTHVHKRQDKDQFVHSFTDRKQDWKTKAVLSQTLFPVRDSLVGEYMHQNFLEYLAMAWGSHLGIVVTPDILWHGLLCEVAQIIAKDPERYRPLFSKSDEQQEIRVYTDDAELLPLDLIQAELLRRTPSNTAVFLPEFSTTDEPARFARYAAFADAMSPYYNYSTYLCGITKVDVRGTEEDYQKLVTNWVAMGELLESEEGYFRKSLARLRQIAEQLFDPSLWKGIFGLKACGSGHQEEVTGWIRQLYREEQNPRYVQNYSSWVSKVDYKNLDTGKRFRMFSGLLSSQFVDGFLVPRFGCIVLENRATA